MRVCLIGLALLAGCAAPPESQQPRAAWVPAASYWDAAKSHGAALKSPDGSVRTIPQAVTYNLVNAKQRIEEASGVRAELAVVDTDEVNAFATHLKDGRAVIAFTIPFLHHLGSDRDAIATTVGHELAHLHLGHKGSARKEREETARGVSQVLGTALNVMGVPFGGYIASAGVTAVARSFTRDEERAADATGLQWAVAAGFDPCGQARTVQALQRIGRGPNIPLLSTHPGYGERSEVANEYSRKASGRGCD